MRKKLTIGSRGSRLALIQAESVAARIREASPGIEVGISRIVTEGDRHRQTQPAHIEGVGVFVKELEEALLDGRIDIAVHSLKDLPTDLPPRLCLRAVTERLDPRDVLVAGSGLNELASGARIGTGSRRRAAQLGSYRPDLKVENIRGNIDTRLRQVSSGEFDGVIVAAAAMWRLGWQDRITEYLPLSDFLPAVGQGALAVEARLGDEDIAAIISPLNHLPAWQSITAERAFLKALGGGCRTPIAALGKVSGNTINLQGMVADVNTRKILRASVKGSVASPEEAGQRLAVKLIGLGASEFIMRQGQDESG
jgi:hydroxymethylbilane synthase